MDRLKWRHRLPCRWVENVQHVEEKMLMAYTDDRRPALYTGNFGDCLGSSAVNVTRFDAAYYKDNMTVLFHLAGNTAIANESLMSRLRICCCVQQTF